MRYIRICLAALAIGLTACGNKAASGSDEEKSAANAPLCAEVLADADSLYSFVAAQTGFGPRTPGSAAHEQCRGYIIDRLKSYGVDSVTVQSAPATTWQGEKLTLHNIFGQINPHASERILLLAHYDTRPWADEEPREADRSTPIDGANDGASGVAVLLEVARVFQQARPDSIGIDLLFVDLEDSGESGGGSEESWCIGSREWASNLPYASGVTPRYGILLDMVGGKDARFHREYLSQNYAKSVVDKVWAMAAASGFADRFPNQIGGSLIDDHIPVNQAGIPCIDIVESANPHTGSFNPTWHTTADNLGSIDPETMRIVAQVVINTLSREDGKL